MNHPTIFYPYLHINEISNFICCDKFFYELKSNKVWINDFKKIQGYKSRNQINVSLTDKICGLDISLREIVDLSCIGCLDTIKYIYKHRRFNISRVISTIVGNEREIDPMVSVLFLNYMQHIEYNDYIHLIKFITFHQSLVVLNKYTLCIIMIIM